MNNEIYIMYDSISLNGLLPDTMKKVIVCSSIDWHYPENTKSMCLRNKSKVCNLCHECDVSVLNPSY